MKKTQNLIYLKHLMNMQMIQELDDIVKEMETELGEGNKKPGILQNLAQYELTLIRLDGST